ADGAEYAVVADEEFGAERHYQRTIDAEHRAAGTGQHTVAIDLQITATRIGFATVDCLHGQPGTFGQRDVEIATGALERADAEVAERRAGNAGNTCTESVVLRNGHGAHRTQLRTKAAGGDIREV